MRSVRHQTGRGEQTIDGETSQQTGGDLTGEIVEEDNEFAEENVPVENVNLKSEKKNQRCRDQNVDGVENGDEDEIPAGRRTTVGTRLKDADARPIGDRTEENQNGTNET